MIYIGDMYRANPAWSIYQES